MTGRLPGMLTAAVLAVLSVPASARADSFGSAGPFALGIVVGEPTGVSGKLFLDRGTHAIDFGIGFGSGYYDDHGTRVHADYLWHPSVVASNRTFDLPFYVGVGALLGNARHMGYRDRGQLGVRLPIGLDMYFRQAPIDVFFELALATNLLPHSDPCDAPDYYCGNRAWLEASLGARYSF
ncbi:MAG TPA: hypothetical protein VML75_05865 [Kofleriaceae bacterium]|nr:hypothetical protein [Kofleriaceae bacterium]